LHLNQIWYQDVPYIPCQIWRQFDYTFACYGSFLQVCEKKKKTQKTKENERLFEGLYFRNGWRDLLQIWYVFSPDMPAPAQQIWSCLVKRQMRMQMRIKSYFVLHVNILTLCVYAPFSWAAWHYCVSWFLLLRTFLYNKTKTKIHNEKK